MTEVVVVEAKRTPIGALSGGLKSFTAPELGASLIKAFVPPELVEKIDQVIMGCVLTAGVGQGPARQAALKAGLLESVVACTVNKVCGSGMQAVIFAYELLRSGSAMAVVAGGMESMTNAPYLLTKGREGYRYGNSQLIDHIVRDGLEDAYTPDCLMGLYAEAAVEHYGFSRQEQDSFSYESFVRARKAIEAGSFGAEVVPLSIVNPKTKETTLVERDEAPFKPNIDRIPTLKPVFKSDGTVTAGNASSNCDGAAAMLMMTRATAEQWGLRPLARVLGHAAHSHAPKWFSRAPVGAIQKLQTKLGKAKFDLYEINEAFAVTALGAMRDLNISHEIINVHGGACALGHPIGASGARVIVTLINALRQHQLKTGVASVCIGGGEALAVAVELL